MTGVQTCALPISKDGKITDEEIQEGIDILKKGENDLKDKKKGE